ncbi:LysR family transcriptional regulator [Gymnodinialimonas sp. 2305UL16-5]|uniref:LysR family transcriptional regulator n=1 Tax=Gymnodinialimonas mytili TaxID=3126503 RepID=UPI0030B70938
MKIPFSEIELRKLDLNLLLVFAAVMRERSVTKAAGRLYLGASAVSMALNRLRETLGDPLFVRSGNVMEPTSQAIQLWEGLEPALGAIEASVRGMRAFEPANVDRTVRFAAPDDLEFVLIPWLIEALAERAPGVRMIVRPVDFRSLVERLDTGDADLALSALPSGGLEARHKARHLHDDSFAVLYDSDQLGRTGELDLETWLDTPHIFLSIAGDLSGPIDRAIAEKGQKRRVFLALSRFQTAPHVLKRRPCLINMPAIAAKHFAKTFDLEVSTQPFQSPTFSVSLCWHIRADSDPFHAWFRELVAEGFETLL